jgi:hypothetical protein
MALVLADAALLKPETQLAEALRDYETILSDEDKNELHRHGLPDAMSAINLTTLIDRKCSSDRSQCLGPRLITFLESIQQFSQVVDTLVSSHPEFAALVWGGVKLALLVLLPPGLCTVSDYCRLRTIFRLTSINCQFFS